MDERKSNQEESNQKPKKQKSESEKNSKRTWRLQAIRKMKEKKDD